MAPLARIQATATEVSRPPEKAMPTRWPTGREVRTLLTLDVLLFGVVGGQRQEPAGEVGPAGRVAADHEHRVVAGDGAEDVGELGLVEGTGEELGGTRRRPEDDQVGARLGADQQLAAEAGQALGGRGARAGRRRSSVTALAGHGVDERAGEPPDLDGVELDEVAARAWPG